jgi:hypothetical protein
MLDYFENQSLYDSGRHAPWKYIYVLKDYTSTLEVHLSLAMRPLKRRKN